MWYFKLLHGNITHSPLVITNRMSWKADLTNFTIGTSWHTHHDRWRNWSTSTWLVCWHFIQIHSCIGICFLCMYTNNSEQKKMGTFYMDSLLYDECPHIQWSWVMITLIILMNCILNDIATCNFLFQGLCLHLTVTNNSCQVWLCTKKVQTLL